MKSPPSAGWYTDTTREDTRFCVSSLTFYTRGNPPRGTEGRRVRRGGRSHAEAFGPSSALTVHRTVIHYRLARFATPPVKFAHKNGVIPSLSRDLCTERGRLLSVSATTLRLRVSRSARDDGFVTRADVCGAGETFLKRHPLVLRTFPLSGGYVPCEPPSGREVDFCRRQKDGGSGGFQRKTPSASHTLDSSLGEGAKGVCIRKMLP